ncbi:flagellar biosynthesis regulator FlaF [Hyphomicrobium sulfonivorans]|uniref:Flagellar protein FlaF n=1 Tax=Hyphomicrobium sulfonivorans TaxID=121290 RepID=A0A109BEM5_HYPSL|nr:flagellar biosynthesis regulator FlaF [Hyphomicrobium sulfonivorans]KWT67428.1 Flagellar protein FlaF [Hyphomicrobium sulfonivorans]MBI1648744.1 flagellar biosynthesis regulator FlaF [Hyphomicrobium sulfonivorans]NSL70721.1 flagellar biosynthesis regulator FlhF [Hyphomicrobium sulfonivorans]
MYQFSYADVLETSPKVARERERQVFERSIELLKAADEKGPNSIEAVEALTFSRRMWAALLEDLASPDNALPDELRAQIISIGIWAVREAENIRLGKTADFKPLIDITTALYEGLQ